MWLSSYHPNDPQISIFFTLIKRTQRLRNPPIYSISITESHLYMRNCFRLLVHMELTSNGKGAPCAISHTAKMREHERRPNSSGFNLYYSALPFTSGILGNAHLKFLRCQPIKQLLKEQNHQNNFSPSEI